jgi:hypothetical protein
MNVLQRVVVVSALTVAALGLSVGTSSAMSDCDTLDRAYNLMRAAYYRALAVGTPEAAQYYQQTYWYYADLGAAHCGWG